MDNANAVNLSSGNAPSDSAEFEQIDTGKLNLASLSLKDIRALWHTPELQRAKEEILANSRDEALLALQDQRQ